MITDAIIRFFLSIVDFWLELMPNFNLEVPAMVFDSIDVLTASLAYALPVAGLMPIFVIELSINLIRIPYVLLIRLKSFIPTMGA